MGKVCKLSLASLTMVMNKHHSNNDNILCIMHFVQLFQLFFVVLECLFCQVCQCLAAVRI